MTREYTSRGKISKVSYYDKDKKPASVNGVYGVKNEYTAYGNLARETWLGQDGKPTLNKDGYAIADYDYDLSYSAKVEKYYKYYLDEKGNPVAASDGTYGISTLYYPETYVHEITYLGQDKKPVNSKEGDAEYQYEEDEFGNYTWEGYFDADGAAINCKDGYSSVEREYDAAGRIVSERYLDRYNKLVNNKNGIAGWNGHYDEHGKLIIDNQYDQNRNPVE